MKKYLVSLYLLSLTYTIFGTSITTQHIDENHLNISIKMDASPEACIYKEYVHISIDNPAFTISQWHSSTEPISSYDETFKETKQAFNQPFTLELQAERTDVQALEHTNIHLTYYDAQQKKMISHVLPVNVSAQNSTDQAASLAHAIEVEESAIEEAAAPQAPAARPAHAESASWSAYVSDLIQTSQSLWIRMILVLLLGLLMSLTPCIYPMIPITVGILNAQGSQSVLKNFLASGAYITGIASTFALLGLLAAFTGTVFGTIMQNPIVIISLVALLVYLAGSMLGLYEMYIPRFMQNSVQAQKGGSLLSLFIFGMISGTVASPCLSPGLVLLLSIVTAISSLPIGFLLLFSFGIGLGIPLLIIGTFSSSLNVLPRAGMWMVEVKKFFGMIMIAICFYFLNNIMPWHMLLALMSVSALLGGLLYLRDARTTRSAAWIMIKNIFGIALVAISLLLGAYTFKAWQLKDENTSSVWATNYASAREHARAKNKKLFIDIGAPFCSMCKAIDKKILHTPSVEAALSNFVALKLNGSDESNAAFTAKFEVQGFPAILIVNPEDETIIKRWSSELYGTDLDAFIEELNRLAK